MTPQTVNAYYSSVKNEIVFPAAILQPPFFDPDADPAVNYGGIGGVIGHEISHGFDDQGRKSDGDGVLRDWWTAEDAAKFEAQAAKLGAQYEGYALPAAARHAHQRPLTMGENIGDLGGLTIALDAYRRSLDGKPAPVIDGFTGEQRVFLGWAQVWRTLMRDDALRQQLVNGTAFARPGPRLRAAAQHRRLVHGVRGDREAIRCGSHRRTASASGSAPRHRHPEGRLRAAFRLSGTHQWMPARCAQ